MATTIHVPKKTRRRNGKKARTPRLPVPVDELPEYREAVEWAVGVRAEAERKIAREAAVVPIGVIQRMDALTGRTVTKRQRDLVELWSGVGARGKNGYHNEYYAIRELMQDFSLLPGIADDVGMWWLFHSDKRGKEYDECVNFHVLIDGHYTADSETALPLKDVLRAVMASLIPEMPTAPALLEMLRAQQRELPECERRQVALSEAVGILNEMEWRRDRIESPERSHIGRRHSVEKVHAELSAASPEDFIVDCGVVQDAAQMRDVIAEFGQRVRACAQPSCGNWFAVDEDKIPYDWYSRCPGCSTDGPKGIFIGGGDKSSEQMLVDGVRERTEQSIDVSVKVALAEGATIRHARELLNGTADKTVEEVRRDLKACAMAGECNTLCGSLQTGGSRTIPITPADGKYGNCHIYRFCKMADGVEGEAREAIATEYIRQINEGARSAARRQAKMFAPEVEAGTDASDDEEPAEVTVQTAMF